MTRLLPGTKIKYTRDNLGLVGASGKVMTGDIGTVIGPGLEPEWIYTEPDKYPQTICPVHESMIEKVSGG